VARWDYRRRLAMRGSVRFGRAREASQQIDLSRVDFLALGPQLCEYREVRNETAPRDSNRRGHGRTERESDNGEYITRAMRAH
jgi:hypothetical protein